MELSHDEALRLSKDLKDAYYLVKSLHGVTPDIVAVEIALSNWTDIIDERLYMGYFTKLERGAA